MVDNQQQTQIYPTKLNIGTSTQFMHTNDAITSEPSWLDVMRDDQTTIDAWARIRRKLKPNQQKDILRYGSCVLSIIKVGRETQLRRSDLPSKRFKSFSRDETEMTTL
jgi:hypothetical protein